MKHEIPSFNSPNFKTPKLSIAQNRSNPYLNSESALTSCEKLENIKNLRREYYNKWYVPFDMRFKPPNSLKTEKQKKIEQYKIEDKNLKKSLEETSRHKR